LPIVWPWGDDIISLLLVDDFISSLLLELYH
jgi:hypothetical protein